MNTIMNRVADGISFLLYIILAWMLVMMFSCQSEQANKPSEEISLEEPANDKADQMIDNLPSPVEMAILVKYSGASYNADYLNELEGLDKYQTSDKKSMNMGVYSADVGYTSLFKQTQETMFYLNNLRKLSDDVGLTQAFDQSVFDRIEANLENRDSLLSIISSAYLTANTFLKDNGRYETAVLMIAGAWIESLYLATMLCSEDGINEEIALRIDQQKTTLNKLLDSMGEFKSNETVDTVHQQLTGVKEIYDASPIATADNEDNINVNAEQLSMLTEKATEIRTWVVQ